MIETLKELSQADWDARKLKTPSLPDFARPYTKFKDKTANGLTKCIIAWFNLSGGMAERISVGGRLIDGRKVFTDVIGNRRQIGSTKWIKPSMKVGSADISGIIKMPFDKIKQIAVSFKIEVKIKKDIQSEVQKKYQLEVEKAGGIYIIAKSWDNFIEQIKEYDKKLYNL